MLMHMLGGWFDGANAAPRHYQIAQRVHAVVNDNAVINGESVIAGNFQTVNVSWFAGGNAVAAKNRMAGCMSWLLGIC